MKKLFVILLVLCFLTTDFAFAEQITAPTVSTQHYFHGHAEITDEKSAEEQELFTGEMDKIEENTEIKMTVSQILSASLTEEGDEFFAEITSEVEGKKGMMLPNGTVAHGTVRKLVDSKRLGRDGYIELTFDYLITPDGREIPIEGKMTTKLNAAVSVAKIVAENTAYTAAGGVIGGYAALNLLGIEAAIASNGYTLAGGAAVGAAVGLGMGLARKGKEVLITPGDEIKIKVLNTVELPVFSENAFRQEEIIDDALRIKITNVKLEKDPFGALNTITLHLSINNFTNSDFSSCDIGLVNDYNRFYHPSIFTESSLSYNIIKSGDRVAGNLSFAVDNPNRKHWLVFYDRRTRKLISKISVDNAEKAIEKSKRDKKKNKRT